MKKIVITTLMLFSVNSLFAWGVQIHATVAKIAENHLTPTAKAKIAKYFDGESIVKYASYADYHKRDEYMLVDCGFDPTNDVPRVSYYPHTFEVDENLKPFRVINDNGRYVFNCMYFMEKFCDDLRHPENLTDSAAMVRIALIVHYVGDMHCPLHVSYYPNDMVLGKYKVMIDKKGWRYHTLWDSEVMHRRYPWGFSDTAVLLDTWSDEKIATVTGGGLYEWAEDCAKCSLPAHRIREGAVCERLPFLNEFVPLAESQVRKAGYRLAKLLNEVLDPGN